MVSVVSRTVEDKTRVFHIQLDGNSVTQQSYRCHGHSTCIQSESLPPYFKVKTLHIYQYIADNNIT